MGADLYIEPFFTENRDKYKALVDEAVNARDAYQVDETVRRLISAEDMGIPLSQADRLLLDAFGDKAREYKALQDKVSELIEKQYEVGYFRDSYNGSSLFWKLGLSWWAMAGVGDKQKKVSLINKEGYITPQKAKLLKGIVLKATITITQKDIEGWAPGTTVESLQKYFEEKRVRFIAFLDLAIAENKSIFASV